LMGVNAQGQTRRVEVRAVIPLVRTGK
jgi:hypothetical protein